jgi:hypothetical protein
VYAPLVVVAVAVFFVLFFLARVEAGTLEIAGWLDLSIIIGSTVAVLYLSRNMFWSSRRAATEISLTSDGVELRYPEGRVVRFSWNSPGPLFVLDDMSEAPSFRKVISTDYFLSDRQRLSALTPDAYRVILSEARVRATLVPGKSTRSWFNPSMRTPLAWSVSGRVPAKATQ